MIIVMLFIVSLLAIGVCCVFTQDTVWNKGYEAGYEAGLSDSDKVSLGAPSEEWPEGSYIIWETFNDSHLDNATAGRERDWYCDYEYTVAIPIYDEGTKRMYPRLFKEEV